MNLKTLPRHIIKYNNHFFKDTKTGELIHTSQLESKCRKEPVNAELKHEIIMSKRYDLNRD